MKKRLWEFSRHVLFFLVLIYVILNSLIGGIDLVVRGVTARMLIPVAVVSLLLGWLLASAALSGWWAAGISGSVGVVFIVGRMGHLGAPLWKVILAGGKILWAWIRWIGTQESVNPQAFYYSWDQFATKTAEALQSLWYWLESIFLGFPAYTYLANRVFWGLVIWVLGVWFCWAMRRYYRPLWGLLPAGVTLGILLTYAPEQGHGWQALVLGAGLILIGTSTYNEQEHRWRKKGVSWAGDVRQRMFWTVSGLSLAAMLLAIITPSVSVDAVTRPVQEWLWGENEEGGNVGRDVLGVEYQAGQLPPQVVEMAGLPRRHLIRSGPELAKRVVMVVRFPPGTPSREHLSPLAFYWRATTYDVYSGQGWESSQTEPRKYEPAQEIQTYPTEIYTPLQQEIRVSNKLRGALFVAGEPLSVDREITVFWRPTSEEPEPAKSLLRDDIFAVALNNSVYQTNSVLLNVDDEYLLGTRLEYPDWVEERYLALPEDIPQRVLDLTAEVVAGQPTVYDQARAIEAYLRTFPYTLDLPDPPLDQDVVDYFLFDLQQGYCDYYATSMVVLARIAGLPARVVVGYAGGFYDEEGDRYLVTEADAHTWPEIYFPEVGWIPFEPTAGRLALERVENEEPLTVPPDLDQPAQTFEEPQAGPGWERFTVWGLLLGGGLLVGMAAWAALGLDVWLLARGTPSATVARVYGRLRWWSVRIGADLPPTTTPHEAGDILTGRLAHLVGNPPPAPESPSPGALIAQLIGYVVQDRYRPIPLREEDEDAVVGAWRRLRRWLWLAWVNFARRNLMARVTETKFYAWLEEKGSR